MLTHPFQVPNSWTSASETLDVVGGVGEKTLHLLEPVQRGPVVLARFRDETGPTALVQGLPVFSSRTFEYWIHPHSTAELFALNSALRKLQTCDPGCLVDEHSEATVVSVVSGDHFARCCDVLSWFGIDVTSLDVHGPNPVYRETVRATSPVCAAKSPNMHTRIFAVVEPLEVNLIETLAHRDFAQMDARGRARMLADQYNWDVHEARKIWAISTPTERRTAVFVDGTIGVQYLNEVKDSLVAAFDWVSTTGPLIGAAWRGVRARLIDTILMADAIHRGGGQVIPAGRKVLQAAQLLAEPTLVEPNLVCEGTVDGGQNPSSTTLGQLGAVDLLPARQRGDGSEVWRFSLPARSLSDASRQFDHLVYVAAGWIRVPGSAFDADSDLFSIIMEQRALRGLPPQLPDIRSLCVMEFMRNVEIPKQVELKDVSSVKSATKR
jgi:elongation factor 2